MDKRYYWIKFKTDFFNQDEIDFLLSQKNGCEYIVLYQMLCLNTANTEGKLQAQIGEMIVPYDVDKIVRETKYFDQDTVVVAIELFKRLGLVYAEEDKILTIAKFQDMVGSETKWAEKKRLQRAKQLGYKEDKVKDNEKDLKRTMSDKRLEYRDKSIDNRDIELDIDTNLPQQQQINNNIYETIEANFGRPLSPMEYEKIELWTKDYSEEVLLHAVKLSVMSNKRVFSYVNGILRNWKSKGYKTLQEIKDNEEVPREQPIKQLTAEEREIFEYDWLNDPDED